MGDNQRPRSLARPANSQRAPSRFAGVKIDLGVIILLCVGVAVAVIRLDYPNWLELVVLAGVGFVCGGWLAIRSHRIVTEHQGAGEAEDVDGDGAR